MFTVEADAAEAAQARQRLQHSVAQRHKARQHARFASADAQLADLLPARFLAGESWHILSRGDIDALSYVKHICRGEQFGALIVSCWAISRPAIEWMQAEFDAGRLSRVAAAYKAWFDALDLPAPTFPNWTPHGWTPAQAHRAARH